MNNIADSQSDETGRVFDDLETLQTLLNSTLEYASDSLREFRDETSGGWFHLLPNVQARAPGSFSAASTATCLAFVRATHRTDMYPEDPQSLLDAVLDSDWSSAGLPPDNPFTVSFLLEAAHDLLTLGARLRENQIEVVSEKLEALHLSFADESPNNDGGIAIIGYPPTSFLTFKAIRTLRSWEDHQQTEEFPLADQRIFPDSLKARVLRWAWAVLHAESVRVSSSANDADVFELAYAVLTITSSTEFDQMTPPQRDVIGYALDQFFAVQLPAGIWPRSRPLFHYPKIGAAYCFDYELLVALLADHQLRPLLRRHMNEFRLATDALERSRFPLGRGYGWASGHLRQIPSAESWSTASVLHFCYELQRLVSDELRDIVGSYVGQPIGQVSPARGPEIDVRRFLDSSIELPQAESISLVTVLEESLLRPLHSHREVVSHGRPFPTDVPTSAIFFGPPGTSKTQLADIVGQALGWPVLKIDPSHLLRHGQDRMHAETYRLFNMLKSTERAVVLLDEFDEFVRVREGPGEVISRMLTTSMLPKLTALSAQRRLVLILATNHLEMLDTAITRLGRFDMIVPVMPPTLEAKLHKWTDVARKYDELGVDDRSDAGAKTRASLSILTYSEFSAIAPRLAYVDSATEFRSIAREAEDRSTMRRKESDDKDWATRIGEQASRIRIPKRIG